MSTNISKKKRDDLLDKIKQIRAFIAAAPQDENTGNLLSYLSELEKDVNGKKYGLVFEEHREEIDEVLDTHTPVLTEDADLFIDHGVQMNFLIEGDNLASLQLLEKTHKGKIDLIYIDPPYNTGAKDFVYDDAFVDTTDGFNHSKWLSFMKQRLSLSKKLLAAHGTIFISIDDNEFSQLKLLCDEVFGANNYVGTILWKKKTNGNNMGWLPPVHDYILCYSKEIGKIYDFGFEVSEEDILKNYSNPDNDPRGPWTTTDLSANHKGPYFPVTNPKTGDVYYPPAGRYWVFNEQEIQRRIADGRIIFGKSGMARPVQRVFAKDRKFSKRKVESWWDNHGMNADPDYIVGISGEIWIIETKGGFDRSGNSQDIDIYTPKKFEVLKAYLDAHGLKGGIVRNDATTDELCICMEHYSDDIGSDDWVLLENIFE